MFMQAHGDSKGEATMTRCLAIAEHLTLLADHSAVSESLRAAAASRDRIVEDIKESLLLCKQSMSPRLVDMLGYIHCGVAASLRPR